MPIITITAVIRVVPGAEETLKAAFLQVAAHVRAAGPGTIDFFMTQSTATPTVFTTYERFVDRAAMEGHNAAPAVKELHRIAAPILDGPIILEIGEEFFAKN
jgi:quinol monooxygenase YgiN